MLVWCLGFLLIVFAEKTCEANDEVCSTEKELEPGTEVNFLVSNPCGEQVRLFWSGQGQEHLISQIPTDTSARVTSYVGHDFVVRGNGKTFERFTVTSDKHTIKCPPGQQNVLPDWDEMGLSYVKYLGPDYKKEPSAIEQGGFHQRVYNYCGDSLELYWIDFEGEEKLITTIADEIFSHITYQDHKFIVKRISTGKIVGRWKADQNRRCRIMNCGTKCTGKCRKTIKALKYRKKYERENGIPYEPYTIRQPTPLHIWDADFVGQTHEVRATHGHCADELCSSFDSTTFTFTVVSTKPRVLVVENFLTKMEADKIINIAIPMLGNSTMGNGAMIHQGNTRTSKTAWPGRTIPIIEHVGRRVMEVMKLPLEVLDRTECLQVVQYEIGQNYAAHWDSDWEVEDMDTKENRPASDAHLKEPRYATFGIHARAAEEGGGTSFPRAFGGKGIDIEPPSGSAILFYNVLPDGNGDISAEHSGMPVLKGQKYFSNVWIHDYASPE